MSAACLALAEPDIENGRLLRLLADEPIPQDFC